MRRAMSIDINEVEKYYTITEDGRVWTKIKGRWLKPRLNMYGYVFYSIAKGTGMINTLGAFAHTLVALKYIGKPPTEKHEIDHIDGNKANNHYTNLRWVTHSENILRSFENGRVGYWLNKPKPPLFFSEETRSKMSDAKKKRICYTRGGIETIFESIEDAARELVTYRKRVYLGIKEGRVFKGGVFTEIKESFDVA
jgi:hypothetical protein